MKVLIIPSWYPEGEDKLMGIYHKEYASALSKNGIDTDILCVFREGLRHPIDYIKKPKLSIYREDGYNVYLRRILDIERISVKLFIKIYIKKLDRLLRDYIDKHGKPDILHAQVTFPAGYATSVLGKKYGIKVLVTEHGSKFMQFFEGKYEPYGKYVLANAQFSTVSNLMKKQIAPLEKNVYVIPNLVDTSIFNLKRYRRGKTLNLITVSAFRVGKGIQHLIESISILVNDYGFKDIRLNIVGDGYLMDHYKNTATSFGVEKYIVFHGQKSREEIAKLLSKSDIFVVPSDYETFCIPGVEALASGLPVVSTKCFGPEEYLDEKSGEFAEVKNPKSIALAIIDVYNKLDTYDPKYLKSIALRYSSENVIKNARKIYEKMIK